MGVPGLYSYINQNANQLLEFYRLKNTKLIIEGSSIAYHLFDRYQKRNSHNNSDNLEGIYKGYAEFTTKFFNTLIDNNVDILVVLCGTWESKERSEFLEELQRDIKYFKERLANPQASINNAGYYTHYQQIKCKKDLYYTGYKDEVFFNVIQEMNIKFIVSTFNGNQAISTISKILKCPVLTANSAFYLYRSDCIFFKSLTFGSFDSYTNKYAITCRIFRPNAFVKNFPGLDSACLVFLGILLEGVYFSDDVLHNFLEMRSYIPTRYIVHTRFNAAFNWLRRKTLHSAAREIWQLMVSIGMARESSKMLIEETLNKYFRMSTYMLHHLTNQSSFSINDKMINKAKNKFFSFKFIDRNKADKEINGSDSIKQADDDEVKKQFENSVPTWFMNDYLMGKFNPFIISLIEHQTYIPWCQWENFEYPSIHEASIPLISLIYSLVITCTSEKQINPLKFYIREDAEVICKELPVMKYPIKLEDIRKADITKRLDVINDTLGIKHPSLLEELPEKWRLFVATAVFWMKQGGEPIKSKIHLNVLLLALVSTVVEEKVKRSRDGDFFDKDFQKEIDIVAGNGNAVLENQESTILQAIGDISFKEAETAASDYLPVLKLQECYAENNRNPALDKLSNSIIHTYLQFECCLENTKNINALLDFPYYQPIINKIFNGKMIFNLCIDIFQHSTEADYIAKKLANAPGVVKVFKLLTEKVDLLL